jgi:hypothetical protein
MPIEYGKWLPKSPQEIVVVNKKIVVCFGKVSGWLQEVPGLFSSI